MRTLGKWVVLLVFLSERRLNIYCLILRFLLISQTDYHLIPREIANPNTMKKITSQKIANITITKYEIEDELYYSLTDMAKFRDNGEPANIIRAWIANQGNIEFLKEWEILNNTDFKPSQMRGFKGYGKYVLEHFMKRTGSISRLIEYTNAKGVKVVRGKYGGTFAHSEIALQFANWLNPQFYVYFIKDFVEMKKEQFFGIGKPSNVKRNLTTGNYSLLVHSLISKSDERLLIHPQPYKSRLLFASEADMLNVIVFGCTAKDWRAQNPNKPTNHNMRDYASVLELVILNNLEFLDAMLIQWDCDKKERRNILQGAYDFQYPLLKRSSTIEKLEELSKKTKKNN